MDGKNRKKLQRKINKSNKQSTPTIRKIGLTLADEIGGIVERLGDDHPDLNRHMLDYIAGLDARHPEWRPVLDRVGDRQLRRLEAHQLTHGQP